jgi:hypothetical protein
MGLLSGLHGHSSKTDISKLQQEFGPILIDGEGRMPCRDRFAFASRREADLAHVVRPHVLRYSQLS